MRCCAGQGSRKGVWWLFWGLHSARDDQISTDRFCKGRYCCCTYSRPLYLLVLVRSGGWFYRVSNVVGFACSAACSATRSATHRATALPESICLENNLTFHGLQRVVGASMFQHLKHFVKWWLWLLLQSNMFHTMVAVTCDEIKRHPQSIGSGSGMSGQLRSSTVTQADTTIVPCNCSREGWSQ